MFYIFFLIIYPSVFTQVTFHLGNRSCKVPFKEKQTLSNLKPQLMSHFNIDNMIYFSLQGSTKKIKSSTLTQKGMHFCIFLKKLELKKVERNDFYVVIKKRGSERIQKGNFFKALHKIFGISQSEVTSIKFQRLEDKKIKILFTTSSGNKYDQLKLQKNKLFLDHNRYQIKIVDN